MKQNLGDRDRAGRMLIGGIGTVAFFLLPRGTAGLVLGLLTVNLFATSLAGWSPLYAALRKSTRSGRDVKPFEEP